MFIENQCVTFGALFATKLAFPPKYPLSMRITPFLAVLFSAFSGTLSAQVINIDFNSSAEPYAFVGLAAVSDTAGGSAVWNQVTGVGTQTISANGLVDSFGNATSIGIDIGINGSFYEVPGQQELGGPSGSYHDLMADYVFISAPTNLEVATKSGTIHGLAANNSYEIYFYSQGNNFVDTYSIGQNGLITAEGESKQTSWDGVSGGDGLFVEAVEYVKFSFVSNAEGEFDFTWQNVVSGPGGNVVTDHDGNNSRFAAINGIQIVNTSVSVPEPAIALLGSLGLLVLLRRFR